MIAKSTSRTNHAAKPCQSQFFTRLWYSFFQREPGPFTRNNHPHCPGGGNKRFLASLPPASKHDFLISTLLYRLLSLLHERLRYPAMLVTISIPLLPLQKLHQFLVVMTRRRLKKCCLGITLRLLQTKSKPYLTSIQPQTASR
jgi:hypothetical protein